MAKLRVIKCFTDKTLNDKKGGVRWEGDVFEATANRAKVLIEAGKVEEVKDDHADHVNKPDEKGEEEE